MSDFRSEILIKMKSTDIDFQTQNKFLNILDCVMADYTITKNTYELMNGTDFNLMCVANYLAELEYKQYSKETLKCYRYTLTNFALNVKIQLTHVNEMHVLNYINKYNSERDCESNYLDKIRGTIQTFLNWCFKKDICKKKVEITSIKHIYKKRNSLTRKELEQIRNACQNDRERFIVEFLYTTGCRVSEFTSIKLKDIDWDNKRIKIVGKGRKERIIYFNDISEIYMRKYLDNRKVSSEYLLGRSRKANEDKKMTKEGIEKLIKNIGKKSDVSKNIYPHIFRHTFATLAVDNGCPLEIVQLFLGHANISTTTEYLTTSGDNLRNMHYKYIF